MGSKILFVDDERCVRDAFVLAHDDDFDIVTAAGAVEALRLLELKNTVAVVVTDYKMPRLNGIELARIIRRQYPEKRIILHTACLSISNVEEWTRDIRVDAFLDKVDPDPGAIGKVRTVIKSSLREYKKNEQYRG